MIVPAKILRVRMVVFHADCQKLLDSLRGKDLFQFADFSENPENWGFRGAPNRDPDGDLRGLYDGIDDLIGSLEAEAKKGFLEEMFPAPHLIKTSPLSIEEIKAKVEVVKAEVGDLEKQKETLDRMRAEVSAHAAALDMLEGFRKHISESGAAGGERAFFGEISFDELPPLLSGMAENRLEKNIFYKKTRKEDEIRAVVLILVGGTDAELVERMLEHHSFQSIPLPGKGEGVDQLVVDVKGTIADLEAKENAVRAEMAKKAAAELNDLRAYLAKVKYEIDMKMVRNMIGKTEMTYLIGGWIKTKDKERFERTVREAADERAEIFYYQPDSRKGDIPVALENPGFIKPFEMLTRMFSPPNYGEIDPTPFLAVAFVLFFGLMFADIFDALLLFVISFFFYQHFKESEEARNIGEIAIICSFSALAFGLIGGEFAGFSVWTKQMILEPENLLLFALFLGVVQIVLGYVLGSVNAIREKDIPELLGGKVGWLAIIAGIGMAYFVFWEWIGLSAAGLALVLGFKGAREALDLTRLLSNVLSYVRLLALNMAHVGLSATFASIVGGLFALGLAGQLSAGIIILVAHIFLVVVSLFAVFAHALRLQYVEFFSKFYEGGGTIFNPF